MQNGNRKKALPAGERAYQHIRNRIVAGGYDDDDMLTEGEVAEELGLSRTPIREALVRLAAESLLILVPKRGAIVRPLTHTEWQELVSARILLEVWSCKETIKMGRSQKVYESLMQSVDEMQIALEESDLMNFVTADQSFHASLIKGPMNNTIAEIYNTLRLRQMRSTAKKAMESGFERNSPWAKLAVQQHKEIAEALKEDDPEAVEHLLTNHLKSLIQV